VATIFTLVYRTEQGGHSFPWLRFELTTSVMIGTGCICSCKSNYHTITPTTAPFKAEMMRDSLRQKQVLEILPEMRLNKAANPRKLCPPCSVRYTNVKMVAPSWAWSYGSWIYNYICNQCLSSLMLWVRISIRPRCTTLYDFRQVGGFLRVFRFPPPIKPTTIDIAEILLKVAFNILHLLTMQQQSWLSWCFPIQHAPKVLWMNPLLKSASIVCLHQQRH
jgi:hypothetical protein